MAIASFKRIFASRLLIIVAALAMRLVFAHSFVGWMTAQGHGNPFAENEPSHIAAHLAQGEGFSSPYDGSPVRPTAQQPPLYPLFIAAIFKLTGVYSHRSLLVITGFSCLLGSLAAFLIYGVGCRWFSPLAGAVAAWIWALSPGVAATNLYFSNYLLSTVFVLVWLLALPHLSPGNSRSFLMGVGLGLVALLNPMLLIVYPASWRWLHQTKRQALLSIAAILLIISPWILRNYVKLGHVYPGLRDSFGQALYVGNHPGMSNAPRCAWNLCGGTYDYSDKSKDRAAFMSLGETAWMRMKLTDSLAYIRSFPGQFVARSAKRAAAFWLLPYPFLYLILTLLAWMGAVRSPLRWFLLTVFLLYPLVFYVTEIVWATSYREPIEPLMLLSVGYFADWCRRKMKPFDTPAVISAQHRLSMHAGNIR